MRAHKLTGVILKLFVIGAVLIVLCNGELSVNKRLPNVLHQSALRRLRGAYLNNVLRSLARARERRGHLTDAGYGSRVSAGSNMASAVMARHGLFGISGPGRRKRNASRGSATSVITNTIFQHT